MLTGPSSDHRPPTKMADPPLQRRALFILYTPDILSFGLNALKIKKIDIEFHFFSSKQFLKLTLRFDGFFTMNPMCYGTPCTMYYRPVFLYNYYSQSAIYRQLASFIHQIAHTHS
jgi:hypothetical protein